MTIKKIGISYNFYQNQNIEIRVNDFIFINSKDLFDFYITNNDESYEIYNLSISDKSIKIYVKDEIITINTEYSNIFEIWIKLFNKNHIINILKDETSFDVLIGNNGIENLRFYQTSINGDCYFVDFILTNNNYEVCTYKPFMKNKLQSIEFFDNKWVLKFEDRDDIIICIKHSTFILDTLKKNLIKI